MNWKEELEHNVKDMEGLNKYLKLEESEKILYEEILDKYPMSIPRYYLSLIDLEDPADPIRKMSIPAPVEGDLDGSFDTSGESENTVMQGMQHKYEQTVMILSTNACTMYCRYCFRKRLVGVADKEIVKDIEETAAYIRDHKEINNALISGGDAFYQNNHIIEKFLSELTPIDHLDYIRFGTKIPVVFPQRIYDDEELLAILKKYAQKKQIYVVTQFSHPKEITEEALKGIQALQQCGIVIKNQAVLMRGVNDNPNTLSGLFKKLTNVGIVPYYVFQCRPVTGVKNQFQVPILEAYSIIEKAKNMQSGQGKCFKYAMSHTTGKIEIVGKLNENEVVFKYHQAKKEKDCGRIFIQKLEEDQCWL